FEEFRDQSERVVFAGIIELDILLAQNHTLRRRAFPQRHPGVLPKPSGKAGISVSRGKLDHIAVADTQIAVRSATGEPGLLENRIKDRCEVAWRGVNDLQYLGSRSLLLQGLAEVTVAGF